MKRYDYSSLQADKNSSSLRLMGDLLSSRGPGMVGESRSC